jgi:hypothetical protein
MSSFANVDFNPAFPWAFVAARFGADQGNLAEARDLLAPAYGLFSDGLAHVARPEN